MNCKKYKYNFIFFDFIMKKQNLIKNGGFKIIENKELKEKFVDERTGIEYIRTGDYYLPNLVLAEQKKIQLNKYGRLRLEFLKMLRRKKYIEAQKLFHVKQNVTQKQKLKCKK